MALSTAPAASRVRAGGASALTQDTLLEMYWHMLRSRRLDERAWTLHRQG